MSMNIIKLTNCLHLEKDLQRKHYILERSAENDTELTWFGNQFWFVGLDFLAFKIQIMVVVLSLLG